MIPLHLSLSGFLSYRDPTEIDFTAFDLACVSGANGAGKSSLLDAITWALFGQARKRDDSVINAQSKEAKVALTFAYEGNTYKVQRVKPRDKPAVLEFQILQDTPRMSGELQLMRATSSSPARNGQSWKPLTEDALRKTEARIEQTLRLDYDTFVNASFFLQGKADQFTQQRPGDRKRILSSILGLEAWEEYRTRAAERRREIETEIAALDGRLTEIRAELQEENSRRTRLQQLEAELARLSRLRKAQENTLETAKKIAATLTEQKKLVEALARQLEAAARQRDELQSRLTGRQNEQEELSQILAHAAEIEIAYHQWEQARRALQYWEEIAVQFREQEKRRQPSLDEINATRARLLQEGQTLQNQQKTVISNQSAIGGLQAQFELGQQSLAQVEVQLAQRAEWEAQLNLARQQQAEAKAENPRLKSEMDELKERIDRLQTTEGATCPTCGQSLTPDDRAKLIADLSAEGKDLGDRFRANTALLRDAEQGVRSLEGQMLGLTQAEAEARRHTQTIAQLAIQLDTIRQLVVAWESEGAQRLTEISLQLQQENFAPEARLKLAEVDAELKAIGYDAAAHDAARRAEIENRSAEADFRALEKAQATLAPLEREIADLQTQINRLQVEVNRQQKEYTDAAATFAAAQAQAPDLFAAEQALSDSLEQENRLRMDVGAARQKVLVLEDLKARDRALEAERGELALRVGQYKQLERAFGKDGIPALLIEQALPQIETKANEILERLSNGTMSVRFATQSPYKDKSREDLKETLGILISDGVGTRDYEMYSGGEAFRINFAIRLALSEVLAQRAGARLQTLVIDEGFGSQDASGRQRLIEAINAVRQDFAKILVITHIEELKEAFPTRIEVEKSERGSTVRVA